MTLTSDPTQPAPTIAVEAWSDPVIDQLGHDPRSAYVEKFWLPILGPSSVWLLRRLADGLDRHPEGFDLDLIDTAQSLGVGMRGGRNAPLLRTFERCCRFGAARMHGISAISPAGGLPPHPHKPSAAELIAQPTRPVAEPPERVAVIRTNANTSPFTRPLNDSAWRGPSER